MKPNSHWSQTQIIQNRIIIAGLAIAFVFLLLVIRMSSLQIINHDIYKSQSDKNRLVKIPTTPIRGEIYDRHGNALAINLPVEVLKIQRGKVSSADDLFEQLAPYIELSEGDKDNVRKQLKSGYNRRDLIAIKFNLSEKEQAIFASNHFWLQNFEIQTTLIRQYPYGEHTAHALGYMNRINNKDTERIDKQRYKNMHYIGRLGLEKYYEEQLHGYPGYELVEKNASGDILQIVETEPAKAGMDLNLELDIHLQETAYEMLGDKRGAVVALDTNNGGVLAFVSNPVYDPNAFVNGISSKQYNSYRDNIDIPLFNRALRGQYPPASTIKPAIGLAFLENDIIDWDTEIHDQGWYQVNENSRFYRDWKRDGHGMVDLNKAIAQSCDTFFYIYGYELGINRMSDFLRQFNLGSKTGIDVHGEKSGILPNKNYKETKFKQPWYIGDTIISSIGQGFNLATPLQLAQFTSIIANKGKVITPHFLKAKPEEIETRSFEIKDPKNWDKIHQSMINVIHSDYGTAKKMGRSKSPYLIAGKSGTAQVKSLPQPKDTYTEEELDDRLKDHALFIAFAPANNPEIAIAVIIENGESGSGVAGPIAKAIIDEYLTHEKH